MDQRILLIEDDAHLARLIGLALGKEGYQVTIQGNGTLGLETAEKESPTW